MINYNHYDCIINTCNNKQFKGTTLTMTKIVSVVVVHTAQGMEGVYTIGPMWFDHNSKKRNATTIILALKGAANKGSKAQVGRHLNINFGLVEKNNTFISTQVKIWRTVAYLELACAYS